MRRTDGFSLLELIVSTGLFLVIVSIAVGGFVSAMRTTRQAATLIEANSNVSLAIEQMARELRTGYDFCRAGCASESELTFRNAKREYVTYRLTEGALERAACATGVCVDTDFLPITGESVEMKYAVFAVRGEAPGDGLQPRVTLSLGVSARETGLRDTVTRMQTTISSRLPLDS